MNRVLKDIIGSSARATDGEIGKITDCYFEDDNWVVRYLMVDAGRWLSGRKVLISPISVARLDLDSSLIHLNLERERVKGTPTWDLARPISRDYETEYYRYYGYPSYWGGTGLWAGGTTPAGMSVRQPARSIAASEPTVGTRTDLEGESHLRSAEKSAGYHIRAVDDEIGHLEDFLMESDSWRIDSIIIDTSNMPGGKAAVVSTQRVERVDWPKKLVFVNATTEEIKNSPEFRTGAYTGRH